MGKIIERCYEHWPTSSFVKSAAAECSVYWLTVVFIQIYSMGSIMSFYRRKRLP